MSCSTRALLSDVLDTLEARTDQQSRAHVETLASHINDAIKSYDDPIHIFRTVEEFRIDSSVPYAEMEKFKEVDILSAVNCHNGQKKLVMSVLEFIASALGHLKCEQKDLFIVYAGASGMASVVAATVFPQTQFILYDPAPNTVSLMPPFEDKVVYKEPVKAVDLSKQLIICTDKAGWFTDDTAQFTRSICPRKHLLFISDIRVQNSEENIVQDMRNQERWALQTGSAMYMFKFRIPYVWNGRVKALYTDAGHMRATGEKLVDAPGPEPSSPAFPYLDGNMHIQLYGRPRTGELRLIGARRGDGSYGMKWYTLAEIEDKLALFNLIYRSHAKFAYGHSKSFFKGSAIDFPSYEAVSEYAIISKCCRALGSRTVEAQRLMHVNVNKLLARFIAKDDATCPLKTAEKRIRHYDPVTLKHLADCVDRIEARHPGELPRELVRSIRGRATAALMHQKPNQNKHGRGT